MKTYKIARADGSTSTRRGHIIRVAGTDLALHKVRGGYKVDHARSGRALHQLDCATTFGPPVKLAEAKADLATDAGTILTGNAATLGSAPVLNPEYQ